MTGLQSGASGGPAAVVGRGRFLLGAAGFVASVAVGVAAASADLRTSTAAAALGAAAGSAAGMAALRWLLGALTSERKGDGAVRPGPRAPVPGPPPTPYVAGMTSTVSATSTSSPSKRR